MVDPKNLNELLNAIQAENTSNKESIRFDYANIIVNSNPNVLAKILTEWGIESINVKMTTKEKEAVYKKCGPNNHQGTYTDIKKRYTNSPSLYKELQELESYWNYAISLCDKWAEMKFYTQKEPISKQPVLKEPGIQQNKGLFKYIGEYDYSNISASKDDKEQDVVINLKDVNQLNLHNSGGHKITSSLITEFVLYLHSTFVSNDQNGDIVCEEIKKEKASNVKASLNRLLHLDKLEEHIQVIIEQIKKSGSRNYAGTHMLNAFNKEVIFKVYKGDKPNNLLQNEFSAIDFFRHQQGLLKVCLLPLVYCYGRLDKFYVLVMEKMKGVTLDKYLEALEPQTSKKVIDKVLEDIIKIGIEGRANNLPTLYGELTEEKINEWLEKGVIKKLTTKKTELWLQKLEYAYNEVKELILNHPFFFNKDIPTGNWMVNDFSVGLIDFENTHFGPIQLDLVTLFEGRNGVSLEDAELIHVLKDLSKKINDYASRNNKNFPTIDENEFIKTYFAASIHRNLSMAGTNKEKNYLDQTIKHLERAEYSTKKLQSLIKNKNSESLQRLNYIIYNIKLNLLQ